MGFSSFIRRRNSSFGNPLLQPLLQSLLLKTGPFLSASHGCCWCVGSRSRAFSSSPSPILQQETPPATFPDPKSSLSARMSFVFDQIDAIERERANKDEALQRIRAWREKKQQQQKTDVGSQDAALGSVPEAVEKKGNLFSTKMDVEVVHPWPEWIELMERLACQNYFDHRRKNEDRMIQDALQVDGITSGFVEEGFDFTRDWATVRNACLNFGRDRFDILRSLSRKDIQILVGHGCPSTDVKVVFSAKLLRKHAHIDEGDVCSSCDLRNTCSQAYLLSHKEDEARTLDVMRVLLTVGFDPVIGSVENKALLKLKTVKTVVRKLLHEVVKLSAVPIDPNLPPPVIKKAPPKVKQPPPPPKKRVGRDDIEMKKGDWLCPKCDFMNFAKNTVCLQCDAKRPKRQLLPGEWECPACNFLNYRRNVVCFHCEHKRPPEEFIENPVQEKTRGARTRLETAARIPGVSDAWNFDFDDNESDGADVAAFEFADHPGMGEGSPSDAASYRGSLRDSDNDVSLEDSRMSRAHERGRYSDPSNQMTPSLADRTGFDDFDDEEDDDIDSYELDMPNKNSKQDLSAKSFSAGEDSFESDDLDDSDRYTNSEQRNDLHSYNNSSWPRRGQAGSSGSPDDDNDDLEQDLDSDTEEWKSSHVADSRLRRGVRPGNGPFRRFSFGSEDELGSCLDSDNDGEVGPSPRGKWSKQASKGKGFHRGGANPESDELLFSSESDSDDLPSQRSKMRGNKNRIDRSRNNSKGDNWPGPQRSDRFRSNKMIDGGQNSFGNSDHDRSFRSFRRNDRGPHRDDHDGWGGNGREHRFGPHRDDHNKWGGNGRERHFGPRRDDHNKWGGNGRERHFGPRRDDHNKWGGNGREHHLGPRRDDHNKWGGNGRERHLGPRRDDHDKWGGNGRERHFRKPNRQCQDEGFGYRQHGRSNGFGERGGLGRDFVDDKPRRRIIER